MIEVHEVAQSDLPRIAALHVDAFPDSVLGQLGVEAVRRNYLWQLTGPHDLTALSATMDGEIVGYLFGGVFRGSTIGFVKREKWFLMRRVVTHPRILARGVGWKRVTLAARLVARRSSSPSTEVPAGVPRRSFGVLAIAVDPSTQGSGVGRVLMQVATESAREAGFESMHLTVHPDNHGAIGFYCLLGWVRVGSEVGAWSGRMTLNLNQNQKRPDSA